MKETFHIKGMHCKSCEIILEEKIGKTAGVSEVKASTKTGVLEVITSSKIEKIEIIKAIQNAGYQISEEDIPLLSDKKSDYQNLLIALLIFISIVALGKIFNISGLININSRDSFNLIIIFLVGITAGLSTCMALVGGLVLGISARYAERHPDATATEKFRPHLFFNLGRILSYFILGGVLGVAGSVLHFNQNFWGALTVLIGFVMLVLGIKLIGILPKFDTTLTLPKKISKLLNLDNKTSQEYSHKNSLILGALTFFLPCGFTQAMQVLAIQSGHYVSGALIMSVFALGTTPGLLGIGGLTSIIKKGKFAEIFFKLVGVTLIALAILNVINGLNLLNLKKFFESSSNKKAQTETIVKKNNEFQVVEMEQRANGYFPNKFIINKNKPVKWVINSKTAVSCASSLVIPDFNVEKRLKKGENVIEFTPTKSGKIYFSCSMGMYDGYFDVRD